MKTIMDILLAAETPEMPYPKLFLNDRGLEIAVELDQRACGYLAWVTAKIGRKHLMIAQLSLSGGFAPRPFLPASVDIAGVRHALCRLATDPAAAITENGQRTGRCAFCNRRLSDQRSQILGYGPTCESRFAQVLAAVDAARAAETILDPDIEQRIRETAGKPWFWTTPSDADRIRLFLEKYNLTGSAAARATMLLTAARATLLRECRACGNCFIPDNATEQMCYPCFLESIAESDPFVRDRAAA